VTGRPRFLVVTRPEGRPQTSPGTKGSARSGTSYRLVADELLSPHGDVTHIDWPTDRPLAADDGSFDALLAEAQAVVLGPWLPWPNADAMAVFDRDRLARATELKVIAGTFDFRLGWIDLDAAARRGVTLVDTSRTMTSTVAEYGVGITFALLRDIPAAVDLVRRGEWFSSGDQARAFVFRDLADCRVGLAGYGSINRQYRSYLRPYGCEVGVYDPFVGDDVAGADSVVLADSLVELARSSDILVVAIPPTPSTLGVVDASAIDALANGSLFVLLSRMAVVEQAALWRRVRAGELRVALDVFDPEPPPSDAWFRTDPNVLPTPHIAGNVHWAHERCFREACADAARVLNGEAPHHGATMRDKRLYEGTLAASTTDGDREG
jgi:phosphoglycerate dehydrogenase-like enzyme